MTQHSTSGLTLPTRTPDQAREDIARKDRQGWYVDSPFGADDIAVVRRSALFPVATCHHKSDGDQILLMARSWDALIAALEESRTAIDSLPEDALGFGGSGYQPNTPDDPGDSESWPLTAELLAQIDAALALAKAKP